MDELIYFSQLDGIAIEHMRRIGKFNMSVKHFHNQYEIFYLLKGERQFFFDNRAYTVQEGSLILVDENAIHMTTSKSDAEVGHERIILYIDREKMKSLNALYPQVNLVKFFKEQYGVFHLTPEQQTQFLNLYHNLKHELDHKDHFSSSAISMTVMMYFIEFIRKNQAHKLIDVSSSTSTKHKTIYSICEYISNHYAEHLTLESLANDFFLSKYYLCRSFKEITGYGINEYIHIHRIKKAKQLLEESSLSVSQIASKLGYDSLTHFEKIFKTYMSISPLKYRKTLNSVTYTNLLNHNL